MRVQGTGKGSRRGYLRKRSAVSKRGVLARREPCGSSAGIAVPLCAIVTQPISPYRDGNDMSSPRLGGRRYVTGYLAEQSSVGRYSESSPASGPAPVRCLWPFSSVALSDATGRKRTAAAPLASTVFEFACQLNLTTHPTATLWAAGHLPAAA